MAKVLCSHSSVSFDVEHFPISLESREMAHPIFYTPQKKLISYLGRWSGGAFTPTDSYMYFLALLHSTELVEFRLPAIRTIQTNQIVANNMERLVKVIIRINQINHPSAVFPRYVLSTETRDLSNVHFWIKNWFECYDDFMEGNRRELNNRELQQKEAALERLIRNPHNEPSAYVNKLADWAAIAGSFPTYSVSNPYLSNSKMPLDEYWKDIIYKASREEKIYAIPAADLEELLEHCETNIPIGSIFSNALFKVLRSAIKKQSNLITLGSIDITKSTYQILEAGTSLESGQLRAIIDNAPIRYPTPDMYPTKMAFLRAKMAWNMNKKLGSGLDPESINEGEE